MLDWAGVLGLAKEPIDATAIDARLRALGLGDDEANALLDAALETGQAPCPARGSRAGFVLFHTPDDRFVLLHATDHSGPQTMALHELANAMTLVVGLAERALHHPSAPLADPRTEIVDRIARTARDGLHVARMVERSEGDASVSERRTSTRGEVVAVLSRVLDGLGRLGASRDVRLRGELEATGTVANEHALAAISWNLVKNAIEASPPGSLVVIAARPGLDCLELEILDEGVGIEARPRKRRGRGVGLAVARALVESLGGTLALTPREPRGTRARVSVPVKLPSAPSERAPSERDSGPPRARLLLLEDDETLRTLVSEHLAGLGWHVVASDDPWSVMEGRTFDLALVDMHLQGEMISDEQLARIRARVTHVVAVTGDPLAAPSVDRVLRKPFALEELVELVEDVTGPAERARLAR